jgi:hypothetical protein
MASKIIKKQYSILGFVEGMFDMMHEQGTSNTSCFEELYNDLKIEIEKAYSLLQKESYLSIKDIHKIRDKIEQLKKRNMPDGKFTAMLGISFCIDLLVEQLQFTKGEKRSVFVQVLNSVENFEVYFNPDRSYDDPQGYNMAEDFRKLLQTV